MATIEINQTNFEALVGKGIVIVDAWASWCGPCRAFAPIFEAAAMRHPDIVWAKLDTQRHPQIASAFNIRAIPTLLVFRDGLLLYQQAGALSASALDELVRKTRSIDMAEVRRKLMEPSRDQVPFSMRGRP